MNLWRIFDPFFFISAVGLVGISVFLLGSTNPQLLSLQLSFFLVGIVLYILVASLDIRFWETNQWFLYACAIIFLILSYFGPEVRGATRWIEIGAIRIQPSEIAKPLVILLLSSFLAQRRPVTIFSIVLAFVFFLPFALLVFYQPDLGNALVYLSFFLVLLVTSGMPFRFLGIGIATFALSLPFVWNHLLDYQKARILSFLSPESDPVGAGYNAIQAMIAVGSGHLWGLGFGSGTQSRLRFLPEFHTDFVFATIGEELGFIGGTLLLVLFLILLSRILLVAYRCEEDFGRLVTVGIFAQLFTQVFINVGMNIGLLPITGITLPFVSYGGSSLLASCITLGLVTAVGRSHKRNPLVIR